MVLDAQVRTGAGISRKQRREMRAKDWFAATLRDGELLVTAHIRTISLETVLLHYCAARRVGAGGDAGKAPFWRGWLCAADLGSRRAALAARLCGNASRVVEDTSNSALQYDRNYLRRKVCRY